MSHLTPKALHIRHGSSMPCSHNSKSLWPTPQTTSAGTLQSQRSRRSAPSPPQLPPRIPVTPIQAKIVVVEYNDSKPIPKTQPRQLFQHALPTRTSSLGTINENLERTSIEGMIISRAEYCSKNLVSSSHSYSYPLTCTSLCEACSARFK